MSTQPAALLLTLSCFSIFILGAFTPCPAWQGLLQATQQDTVPQNDTSSQKIFEAVEEEAYFPGGEQGWRQFLETSLNPAIPVDNGAPPGLYTVVIQFVVERDGRISDIRALTRHGFGMENEVMRILRKSPRWVPAVQFQRPVRAYRKQPVTFQVTVEKKKRKRA